MPTTIDEFRAEFSEFLPFLGGLAEGSDIHAAITKGLDALAEGSLSWAQLNQLMHRCSAAGMSEGCFRYYLLEVPGQHPYPVHKVLSSSGYKPTEGGREITSLQQIRWGLQRFVYDAMLYWGNFRQAYRDIRLLTIEQITDLFSQKRVNEQRIATRGKVVGPTAIPRDHRYLISEMACKTYEAKGPVRDAAHVKLALEAFRALQAERVQVTPDTLRSRTKALAEGNNNQQLFELMFEDAPTALTTEEEVVALYSGQWDAFEKARTAALENTRIYLSLCNDLCLRSHVDADS